MKSKVQNKIRLKVALVLSIIMLTSFSINFQMNSTINAEKTSDNKDIEIEKDLNPIEIPKSSAIGEHRWWNPDWPYRILIDITNDAGVDLKNYGVWVVFPYGDAEFQGKLNDTLKDIRIIEYIGDKPYVRDYYIYQNYSYFYDQIDGEHKGTFQVGKATIFFNTNISAAASPESDTYIYFGNMGVQSAAVDQGLGLVKNGNFDYVPSGDDPTGTPEITPYSYDPVGWNWSHNVPDDIIPWGDIDEDDDSDHPIPIPSDYWQNCLIGTPQNQEKKLGTYTYKWGTNETIIPQDVQEFTRYDDDYAGVVYSNPFIVPIVGNGNPLVDKLYLNLWRNIRVCGFDYKESQKDIDGYYVRIINATAGIGDPDSHQKLYDYLEIYTGVSNNYLYSEVINYTTGSVGNTLTTYSGYLEDDVIFDISQFMGMNVSIEIGMFGDEGGTKDRAFGQIDEIYFTYDVDLTVELNEIQTQKTEITIITRDVDDRIVPHAEVSLVQGNTTIKKQTTDSTGKTIFTNLNFGVYNFSVNYTFKPSYEFEVFNSTRDNYGTSNWDMYQVEDLDVIFDLNLDIWTIDFEIVDWDRDPLDDGYVKILNQKGGTELKTISLINGSATFRWWNASHYFYEVYFDNDDYAYNNFLLNSSYIYRSNYIQNEKNFDHELNVNDYNQGSGNYFKVNERIFTKGSMTDFSTKKLINFNITLENMNDHLDNLTIYYIDQNNQTVGNLIYENLTYSDTDQNDFVSLDLRSIDNDKLKSENYEVYGILIEIQGQNSSISNGVIKINTTEAANVYNITALTEMHIRIIDREDSFNPVPFVSVRIINGTNDIITTLSTYEDGWASHDADIYKPFIYLRGHAYNISLRRIGEIAGFWVNDTTPEQWEPPIPPPDPVEIYNYTLNLDSTIILDFDGVAVPPTLETQIEGISENTLATWGLGSLDITVNVSYSLNGISWTLISEEGTFTCSMQDWDTGQIVLVIDLIPNYLNTNYSMSIDSNRLSAGTTGFKNYWFIIEGEVPGYQTPEPYYTNATVIAQDTAMSLYDYDTFLSVSQYEKAYGEIVKLAVQYNDTNMPLPSATITFDWAFSATKYFLPHPIDSDFQYISFNTSEAFSAAPFPITFTAVLENYSVQTIYSFLNVKNRPTTINNNTQLYILSPAIWVQDPINYTFVYRDILKNGAVIGDLDDSSYDWQEIDDNGDTIPGHTGSGSLISNPDDTYTLNFSTQIRKVGIYRIFIKMQKLNYEDRAALITLTIKLREFDADLDAKGLEDDQINIVKGDKVELEIELLDETRGDIPLTGAKVVLDIGGKEYEFDEDDPGIYTYTFDTEEFEAFFTSQTLTGEIIIKKTNFTSEEIDITIVVEMEEISEGVPTFYFIMVVAAITALVGGLVSYRIIQQTRIPKHVKRLREVKKKIKARDSIPKSLLVPSKEELIVKQLGEVYNILGVSLEETLGIKDNKSKASSEIKDSIKQKGDET